MLADVARLAGEHDCRLALARDDDVRVTVHDHEAGQVRDRALEAAVLAARDDGCVEALALQRGAHDREAPV